MCDEQPNAHLRADRPYSSINVEGVEEGVHLRGRLGEVICLVEAEREYAEFQILARNNTELRQSEPEAHTNARQDFDKK